MDNQKDLQENVVGLEKRVEDLEKLAKSLFRALETYVTVSELSQWTDKPEK